MQTHEFESEIKRLKSCYGASAYPDERIRILWEQVKDLTSSWFKSTVTKLIGSSKQAPLMPEFMEAISIEKRKTVQFMEHDRHQLPSCKFCIEGIIHARNETQCLHVFLCPCSSGGLRRENFPRWNSSMHRNFNIELQKPTPKPETSTLEILSGKSL